MKPKTYKLVAFIWTLHNNVVPLRTELAEINIMCPLSLISRSWGDSVPSFALSTIFSISVIYYRAIWFESELWLRTEDLVPKSGQEDGHPYGFFMISLRNKSWGISLWL